MAHVRRRRTPRASRQRASSRDRPRPSPPPRDSIDRRSVSRAPARRARSRAPRRACFERRRTRENPRQFPRTAVLFSRRSTTPGWDARARDATDEFPSPVPPTPTQWVSTLMAIALLWGFVIACLVDPTEMSVELNSWKTWISRNTGWLFIAAFVRAPLSSLEPRFSSDANRHVTPRFSRKRRRQISKKARN